MTPEQEAFNKFSDTFDTLGNEWQDMNSADMFVAGYKAACATMQAELDARQARIADLELCATASFSTIEELEAQLSTIYKPKGEKHG